MVVSYIISTKAVLIDTLFAMKYKVVHYNEQSYL